MRDIKVVYEDEWLLVVDKPAGIVVDKSATTKNKLTIEDWLGKNRYLVHRLDKETSGLLVTAKTEEAKEKLQALFKERKIEKTYWTLVHGLMRPRSGTINLPISRSPFNRKRFGIFVGGRTAETSYQVIDNYLMPGTNEGLSFLEVKPKTGRTHQIRVHLKHLGYPIVADGLYGGRKTSNKDKRLCWRLFLQAAKIKFVHPITKKQILLELRLAKDLQSVLKKLKKV